MRAPLGASPSTTGATMAPLMTLPYELRLGVVGHRDLLDPDGVAAAVEGLLRYISATLNQQEHTPLEWTIISPLAKGADRIVARAVLSRSPARLEVVTPFPLDEYRRDFKDSHDRKEFEALLERAAPGQITELGAAARQEGAELSDEMRKNHSYLEAGKRVVDTGEILIAVWNGEPQRSTGGTAQIVNYALHRGRLVLWIDSNHPSAGAHLIRLERRDADDTVTSVNANKPYPLPSTSQELSIGYHELATYSRERAVNAKALKTGIEAEAADLDAKARRAGLAPKHLVAVKTALLPHFVRADRLAKYYQRRHMQATLALNLSAALAVTVVAFQVLLLPQYPKLTALEVLALISAVMALLVSHWRAWHEKWLQDRYLAEQLRTASFTVLLGEAAAGGALPPERTLPFYEGPHNWLRATAQRIAEATQQAVGVVDDFDAVRAFLISAWLDDQARWHERRAHEKHTTARLGRWGGVALFVVTGVLAVQHLRLEHDPGNHSVICSLGNWITFFTIVLPAWGAAVHAIITQLEYERIASRSAHMAAELRRIAEQCEQSTSIDELRRAVRNGASVIGIENHEWWIVLSFRRPELPA